MKSYKAYHTNSYDMWVKCCFCGEYTFQEDRVCDECRSVVPKHIPFEQVKRFVERRNIHVKSRTVSKGE